MARFDTARRVLVLRVVFAALALLCVVGWLLTRWADAAAVRGANAAVESRTTAFATSVARLVDERGGGLVVSAGAFSDAARRAAATDPTIARARLWDASGALLASSDARDRAGKVPLDQGVRSALRGDVAVADAEATWVPPGGGDPVTGTVIQAAVPLRLGSASKPAGAVEMDFDRSAMVTSRWRTLSIALVVGATLFGIGFVWAMTRRAPAPPVVHKKVEPPSSAPTIAHDFALRPKPSAWVAAPSDAPPPTTSVAELEAATSRIADLEEQLRRAAEESERVTALEEQVAADAPEIEALRARLAQAEARALGAETLLVTAQDALAAAHTQIGDTRVDELTGQDDVQQASDVTDTEARTEAPAERNVEPEPEPEPEPELSPQPAWEPEPQPTPEPEPAWEPEPQPTPEPEPAWEPEPQRELAQGWAPEPEPRVESEPNDPTDLIAVLEARVAEAEARAQHAKEEAMQLSPEASDLRVRLARTAARKKMGSSAG
jgi:hypothetical protein